MSQASNQNPHEKISDADLAAHIKEISQRIIEITDSPTRGMADMEIGRDPDSNATEGEFAQGQFIPGEEQTVDSLHAKLRELELERDRRLKGAA